MMSPLEYLFVMMMNVQKPDPAALARIEPASGTAQPAANSKESFIIDRDGRMRAHTILMHAQGAGEDRLEAPVRITKPLEPLFKIGAPVSVSLDSTGKTYDAKIARIVTTQDDSGETIQAIIVLNTPDTALQPGQTVTATIKP